MQRHPTTRRTRLWWWWSVFALCAMLAGAAVLRLYQSVAAEVAEQGERAARQELQRVQQRVGAVANGARRASLGEMAALHVDGLGVSLRRWDEANRLVVGTFLWEPDRGFVAAGTRWPEGFSSESLPVLWRTFREWRTGHPEATRAEPLAIGEWSQTFERTVDNPLWPATELGYQSENLEIVAHDGGRVDPWAACAVNVDRPMAPWVLWYQAGPGTAVRGALLDPLPLLEQLQGETKDASVAAIAFGTRMNGGLPAPRGGVAAELEAWPGCAVSVAPGDVFQEKAARARLTALVAALVFAAFLAGGTWLTLHTRREARAAEARLTFVAQVSHELRTPLTSIRMFADLLGGEAVAEEKRRKFATRISTESQRLSALIERLLAFNALAKNPGRIAGEAFDAAAVVRATLEEQREALRAAGVTLEEQLPAGEVSAWGDASATKQALLNLVDNVIKYGRDGGWIEVRLRTEGSRVTVAVADRGPGLPEDVRRRLFEPFVQGGRQLTNKTPGLGLGLSLARGLLRQAGGDLVWVAGGRGTTFEIRLRTQRPEDFQAP